MADSDDAGEQGKSDSPKPGVASPAESQGEGNPPGDWMKKSQFVAALNDVTRKNDLLQAQINELKTAQQQPAQKPATRAELNALVAHGDLTQVQSDTIWENQITDRVRGEATAAATHVVGAAEHQRKVDSELASYRELVPQAWEDGSSEREKASREYSFLVGLSLPQTKETELAALRAAFGDISTLRASKSARPGSSETHVESGGGRPPAGEGGGSDGPPKGLTPREKDHYEKAISRGIYANWAAVKDERKGYAKSKAR